MNVDNTKSFVLQYAGTFAWVVALLVLLLIVRSIYKKYVRDKRNKLARKQARLQYESIVGMARELNGKLGKVSVGRSNPLDQIVEFFSLTSSVQDTLQEITLQEDYFTQPEYMQVIAIRRALGDMGRCENGWNRTRKGENVTEDKVFLGNIFGIWTFSVAWFKREYNHGGFTAIQYGQIQEQARRFMVSHMTHLTTVLDGKE